MKIVDSGSSYGRSRAALLVVTEHHAYTVFLTIPTEATFTLADMAICQYKGYACSYVSLFTLQ